MRFFFSIIFFVFLPGLSKPTSLTFDQNSVFNQNSRLLELNSGNSINNAQTLILLERLRYKSNNRLLFRDADMTYRRLVNVPKEDREAFKAIIGDLGKFQDLNNLLPIAAKELVEQKMN